MKWFLIAIAVLGWPLAQALADGGPDMVLPSDQIPLTAPSPPPENNPAANGPAANNQPSGNAAANNPAASNPAANGVSGSGTPAETVLGPCDDGSDSQGGFFHRFISAYNHSNDPPADDSTPPARRALPGPFDSPPFPSAEYQGYPLVGVPESAGDYPLMKALKGTCLGDWMAENRIKAYGWANASLNASSSQNSNMPSSYWLVPNTLELDQFVFRIERVVDSVQQDHVDWGFRSTILYGTDYRYMTAGGWFSDQLLQHNDLYGVDPTEQYFELYVPGIEQGVIFRVGRWIACPDIETQFAPDNYMATHSLLFTFDTYTQTGVMATVMLNKQWTVQACINAGTDMAPWYPGAIPTGMFAIRWVSCDNKDSIYTALNDINNAKFRYFYVDGQLEGHDNFNYIVSTWQHTFSPQVFTKTEGYFMWQLDAPVGGTPSFGPTESFGGGGGFGPIIPGVSHTFGVVNYTCFETSKTSFITFRNEWWDDEQGERSGYAGIYTSDSVGWSKNITPELQVRPEIGYYRNWDRPAFDLGTKKDMMLAGLDMTLRF